MGFEFEKIFVPEKHSFISRKLQMGDSSEKIHSQNNYELNYVVSGSGKRIIGNHISSYKPGDLVLIGPNIPHNWQVIETEKDKTPLYAICQKYSHWHRC